MNFFGVGPAELLVILVVALVFVGPERLPKLAADIARTIREIRKYTSAIAAEFNEVIQDFEKETAGDRSDWKEIGQGLTEASKSITDAVRGAHADASAALAPPPTPGPASPTLNGAAPAGAPQPAAEWRDIADPAPPAEGAPEPHVNGATPSAEPAQGPR
jgi:sec-independent protein translocase protein TatB